jgi:hypothetical protein
VSAPRGWGFTYNGVPFEYPSEREAKAAAFRASGKIGAVEIYPVYSEKPERSARDLTNAIKLWATCVFIGALGIVTLGLTGVLDLLLDLIGFGGGLIVMLLLFWGALVVLDNILFREKEKGT